MVGDGGLERNPTTTTLGLWWRLYRRALMMMKPFSIAGLNIQDIKGISRKAYVEVVLEPTSLGDGVDEILRTSIRFLLCSFRINSRGIYRSVPVSKQDKLDRINTPLSTLLQVGWSSPALKTWQPSRVSEQQSFSHIPWSVRSLNFKFSIYPASLMEDIVHTLYENNRFFFDPNGRIK